MKMKLRQLLICSSTFLEAYYIHGHCIDIHGHIVSQGLHYVPGTNPCTLCICDKGGPKWCKSVLCSPPQNCKSFQVGNSCCEFKCLDDILSGHDTYKETYDVALRFIASTVTAVLSISLLFFLYNRLKRNNILAHHNHQNEDQRTLSNVGYIAGNFGYTEHGLGYLGSGNNDMEIRYEETSTNFSLWKPPGNYFPSGEAPPPYEEAMRAAQNEIAQNQLNTPLVIQPPIPVIAQNPVISTVTSAYPQEISTVPCRHEHHNHETQIPPTHISSNTHQYVNIRVHNTDQIIASHKSPEVSYENIKVLKQTIVDKDRAMQQMPTSSSSKVPHHRTRSRDTPAKSYENYLIPHIRHDITIKTKINDAYRSQTTVKTNRNDTKKNMHLHRTLPKNLRELLSNSDRNTECYKLQSTTYEIPTISFPSNNIESNPPPSVATNTHITNNQHITTSNTASTNNACATTVHLEPVDRREKDIKNLISYQSLSQDEEDYRSECENCKSVVSTIADDDGEGMNETMSLQRRPLPDTSPGYELCYRTSLTLPSNTRKPRAYPNQTNRGKWFSSMQQSSSEESD